MHSLGGVDETCFIFVIVTVFYIGLSILVTPKLAKGVRMDDSLRSRECVHQMSGAL